MLMMLMANTDRLLIDPMTAVSAMASVIATSDRPSGIMAATTAPKTISSTMRAMGAPIDSPRRRSVPATFEKSCCTLAWPVTRVVKPPCPSA